MARGELDGRLTDGRQITAAVVDAVLADHQAEAEVRCAQKARREVTACACGYEPTRQQPVCRSVVVAQAVRWGRAPQWHGPADEHEQTRGQAGGEQLALFTGEKGRA